jgi:hypothetical protein
MSEPNSTTPVESTQSSAPVADQNTNQTGSASSIDGTITIRSIVIGLVACGILSIAIPLSEFVVGASRLNLSQLPVAAMGFFFTFVIVNSIVGRISKAAMLNTAELVVVFVMSFLASIMATSDMLNWPLGVMGAPYYYATPENRWIEDVWPHLQQWWVVQGPREELRWAFVGLPNGETIPWGIWATPMFWWGSFIGAVGFASMCIATILRKQWADNERLAFPLAQVPLEIMSDPGGKWNLPKMLRTPAFWVGASIPMFLILYNMISYFEPQFPKINMGGVALKLGGGFPDYAMKLNFYVLGFAYLVNTNILFSVWFWNLLVLLESGIAGRVGFSIGDRGDPYSSRDALTGWQGFGGFIVFVLVGLWMARGHLRHVWNVIVGVVEADDDNELLPYRWAFFGLVASTFYLFGFMIALGMNWLMAVIYLFGAFIAFVGTTRLVAQTGIIYMQSPLTPTMFTFATFGTVGIPGSAIVGMVGTYSLVVNGRAPLMPAIFHAAYLGGRLRGQGRKMFTVIAMGLTAAFVIGGAYYLWISYNLGATTLSSVHWAFHGNQIFDTVIKKMQARVEPDLDRWIALGAGAVFMTILTFVQYRFPAWPIHPIGFPIAAANMVNRIAFTIMFVWLVKIILLKIGGQGAYEKARPAFIGIAAGYAFAVMLSFVVDLLLFKGVGHPIHGW